MDCEAGGPVPAEYQSKDKHKIANMLYSAKPLSWRGFGELPQLSWRPKVFGLVVVLDLWAGFSGALIALLSLGLRVVAVAAETNQQAVAVARANFPNLVEVEFVEEVRGEILRPLLARRSVEAS